MTAYDINSLFEDSSLIGVVFAMMCGVALTRKGQIDLKWFWLSLSILALILYASTVGRWLARPLMAGLRWNWSGFILGLIFIGIILAFMPAQLRSQMGLQLRQAEGSLKVWIGIGIYALIFIIIALNAPPSKTEHYWESLAFQLTMPSLNEEIFYRGLFPVILDRCFGVSRNILGAKMGWGAIISSVIFGLAHGLSLKGGFSINWLAVAIPGFIGLIGCWVVSRTNSLLGPILMHSHGNSIDYII